MKLRIRKVGTVVVAEEISDNGRVYNTPLAAKTSEPAEEFLGSLAKLIRRKQYQSVTIVGLTGRGKRFVRSNGCRVRDKVPTVASREMSSTSRESHWADNNIFEFSFQSSLSHLKGNIMCM
jgi:hypothetical protein